MAPTDTPTTSTTPTPPAPSPSATTTAPATTPAQAPKTPAPPSPGPPVPQPSGDEPHGKPQPTDTGIPTSPKYKDPDDITSHPLKAGLDPKNLPRQQVGEPLDHYYSRIYTKYPWGDSEWPTVAGKEPGKSPNVNRENLKQVAQQMRIELARYTSSAGANPGSAPAGTTGTEKTTEQHLAEAGTNLSGVDSFGTWAGGYDFQGSAVTAHNLLVQAHQDFVQAFESVILRIEKTAYNWSEAEYQAHLSMIKPQAGVDS